MSNKDLTIEVPVSSPDTVPGDTGWRSYYSAFLLMPGEETESYRDLFSYSRGVDLPGSGGKIASRSYTNVPRSGNSGLPKCWTMRVTRWRARTTEPLLPHIVRFFASTAVTFIYNDKRYAETTLLDLIHDPQPVEETLMRENLMYKVDLVFEDAKALNHLVHRLDKPMLTWIYLEGIGQRVVF